MISSLKAVPELPPLTVMRLECPNCEGLLEAANFLNRGYLDATEAPRRLVAFDCQHCRHCSVFFMRWSNNTASPMEGWHVQHRAIFMPGDPGLKQIQNLFAIDARVSADEIVRELTTYLTMERSAPKQEPPKKEGAK